MRVISRENALFDFQIRDFHEKVYFRKIFSEYGCVTTEKLQPARWLCEKRCILTVNLFEKLLNLKSNERVFLSLGSPKREHLASYLLSVKLLE